MTEKYLHRCRWLYQPEKKVGKFDHQHWPKAVLYCWQKGKKLIGRECTPCLIARSITVHSSMVNSLPHKQPMVLAKWEKSHGRNATQV